MKYCETTTRGTYMAISFPESIENINALLSKEGYDGVSLFANEVIINMDYVEKETAIRQNRSRKKSMDLVCGLSGKGEFVMLLDCKFNHLNFVSLKKEEIEQKVAGSKEIIAESIQVYYYYFFIVKDDMFEQARSRFFRMNPKPGNEYQPITVAALKETYF